MAKYTVQEYIATLELAGRSPKTCDLYAKTIKSYADFLKVPLEEVHDHLSVGDLLKYAASRKNHSARGTRLNLSILQRYFKLNDIAFDELQAAAMKPKRVISNDDKPLTIDILQKMMDLTDVKGKAILSFLVSTGCRAGETCTIRLSDIDGDIVTIPNEIAKHGKGGKVYLTQEAREYLDAWLKIRDHCIKIADARQKGLVEHCGAKPRPKKDDRLFSISYGSLQHFFDKLYDKADGETKNGRARCTLHSTRKYFRTNAVHSMELDVVEKILRHSGYLTDSYVRLTDAETRENFHKGEAALYITRADHRIQAGKLSELEQQNKDLREQLKNLETQQTMITDDLKAKTRAIEQSPRHVPDIDKIMARMNELEEKLAKLQVSGN